MTKQDYRTPPEFLAAIQRRYGPIDWDLAAKDGDEVVPNHITPEQDSLATPWPREGLCFLNPPYRNPAPWAAKCAAYDGDATILFLILASVETQWWDDSVRRCASEILALTPRVQFVGADQGINRPLVLIRYARRYVDWMEPVGLWRWKLQPHREVATAGGV